MEWGFYANTPENGLFAVGTPDAIRVLKFSI
jgi:hypothetical protein